MLGTQRLISNHNKGGKKINFYKELTNSRFNLLKVNDDKLFL